MKEIITINTKGFHRNILFNLLNELGFSSIEDFQLKNNLKSDGLFGKNSYNKLYEIILKPQNKNFEGHYFKQKYEKKQIILHHSAGWDNARGMFDWWIVDNLKHVGTSIGITDNGNIIKGFDEEFWAASIGCNSNVFTQNGIKLKYRNNRIINNQELDECAVAVEICNWGSLTEKNGKYYSWTNHELPSTKVIKLDYKNSKYYEKYTPEEIKSLKYWILLNSMRFIIPIEYNYDDLFSVSKKALSGIPGLYTHNSYRIDKNDISPQPEIIEMLKLLPEYLK
jgi:hypothetical protein